MSKNNNSKLGVSFAMILTIIGLLILTAGTLIGGLLRGWPTLEAVVGACGVLLLCGTGVFFATRAKSANNDYKHWALVKWLCLLGVAAGIVFSVMPTMTMFNFMAQAQTLRQSASADIRGLRAQLDNYRESEAARVERTWSGIASLANMGAVQSNEPLIALLERNSVLYTANGAQYVDAEQLDIERDRYMLMVSDVQLDAEAFGDRFDSDLRQLTAEAGGSDPFLYARLASRLAATAALQDSVLTALSASMELPEVSAGNEASSFSVGANRPNAYSFEPARYAEAFASVLQFHWSGFLLALLSALAAVACYFLTPSSRRMRIDSGNKRSDDLGLIL